MTPHQYASAAVAQRFLIIIHNTNFHYHDFTNELPTQNVDSIVHYSDPATPHRILLSSPNIHPSLDAPVHYHRHHIPAGRPTAAAPSNAPLGRPGTACRGSARGRRRLHREHDGLGAPMARVHAARQRRGAEEAGGRRAACHGRAAARAGEAAQGGGPRGAPDQGDGQCPELGRDAGEGFPGARGDGAVGEEGEL